MIACEDTRVTHKLLDRYGIARPLTPYHEHNATKARPKLLRRLAAGAAIALVSDAGTPLISDPGYKLVARRAGSRSRGHGAARRVGRDGGPGRRGFADRPVLIRRLSAAEGGRAARPALPSSPASRPRWFCSKPGRALPQTLADLAAGLGRQREAALCRELTKLHEEIRRGELAAFAESYAQDAPRGEIVLVIAPPQASEPVGAAETETLLRQAMARVSLKDAVGEVARRHRPAAARSLSARTGAGEGSKGRETWRAALSRGRPAKAAPRPERVAAFRLGLSAESRAAMFLVAKGYRIVARRWKTPFGEIDIVARRRRTLVFVEVKARGRISMTPSKR